MASDIYSENKKGKTEKFCLFYSFNIKNTESKLML